MNHERRDRAGINASVVGNVAARNQVARLDSSLMTHHGAIVLPSSAADMTATNRPTSATTIPGPILRPLQSSHERAADDQAVGHRSELTDLVRAADPESDADWQVGPRA